LFYILNIVSVKEEHKLRIFEKVLKEVFSSQRDEVTGGWRKLYDTIS
jgi:hypothetical protein